jgi:hypothetical protein
MLTQEQKFNAWQWLAREAIAGNPHAVAVLVDWTGPEEDVDSIEQIAATFQWWLDEDARRPATILGAGVIPPKLPSLKKVCEWIADLNEAIQAYRGTEYAEKLAQIARCLAMLTEYRGLTPDAAITPPVWPMRHVLEDWITTLAGQRPLTNDSICEKCDRRMGEHSAEGPPFLKCPQ